MSFASLVAETAQCLLDEGHGWVQEGMKGPGRCIESTPALSLSCSHSCPCCVLNLFTSPCISGPQVSSDQDIWLEARLL